MPSECALNHDDCFPLLLQSLNTSLVLHQLAPYLPIRSRLGLAATCKTAREVLYSAPETFRYVDLSRLTSAGLPSTPIDNGGINWRSQRMDEALTEDEFYSGPLRGIFSKLHKMSVLTSVQVMILDGLSVPADLVHEIISNDRYAVRVLSIREAKHLNMRKLRDTLRYAVRSTRPPGTPRLKGLYVFGPKDLPFCSDNSRPSLPDLGPLSVSAGVMSSEGAQIGAAWNHKSQETLLHSLPQVEEVWYRPSGRVLRVTDSADWATVFAVCEDIIAFDAVLCRGPRHQLPHPGYENEIPQELYLPPRVAVVALGPCHKCGSSNEGPARPGLSPKHHLPMLTPLPLHSSSIEVCQMLPAATRALPQAALYARCEDCLRGRWCERCFRWWDEQCYAAAETGRRVQEVSNTTSYSASHKLAGPSIPVHLGLCIERCLVGEMMSGAGSNGMWG